MSKMNGIIEAKAICNSRAKGHQMNLSFQDSLGDLYIEHETNGKIIKEYINI